MNPLIKINPKQLIITLMRTLLLSTCVIYGSSLFAESGRSNYDLDGDGLIEINDLDDLNEIRTSQRSLARLYGELTIGCPYGESGPYTGCSGYELMSDLDFDTNQDGVVNSKDKYWNDGQGWKPIAKIDQLTIDGNGHTIKNLVINRPGESQVGLFGLVKTSQISNLYIGGHLSSVKGADNTGGLVGNLIYMSGVSGCGYKGQVKGTNKVGGLIGSVGGSYIEKSYATGYVNGIELVGGLAGRATTYDGGSDIRLSFYSGKVVGQKGVGGLIGGLWGSYIKSAFATGLVFGEGNVGGLVGQTEYRGGIDTSFAVNSVEGEYQIGGIVGEAGYYTNTTSSYWAVDVSGQQLSAYFHGKGVKYLPIGGGTLRDLACPLAADTGSGQGTLILYQGWEKSEADQDGVNGWDFGDRDQIPGLVINGRLFRDSDGDGWLDGDDPLPIDTDNDGEDNYYDWTPLNANPIYSY